MSLATSFFFLVTLCSVTVSATAADETATPQTVGSLSDNGPVLSGAAAQPRQPFPELLFPREKPITLNRPSVSRAPLATFDDGTCYTMRTYKVKPQEHFADGETGSRGYSTCELAKNYQVRSAVDHHRGASPGN